MLRSTVNIKDNNKGFSLIELIIVVGILAIATIPLMKSMGMASSVNARAQSIQNATSLGERVMEEIKSAPIEKTLKDAGKDLNSFDTYGKVVINRSNQFAAQAGEKFDVKITIDRDDYKKDVPHGSTNKYDIVKSINKAKIPTIEDIDTLSQAVLSSEKELNKYDDAARSYFNEKKADYDPTEIDTYASVVKKTINIVKKSPVTDHINIRVSVIYEDNATPTPNKYLKDLYTGDFIQQKDEETSEYLPLDSNIYIFYKDTTLTYKESGETKKTKTIINIKDTASVSGAVNSFDSHRVYFIRQKTTDKLEALTISFNDGSDQGSFTTGVMNKEKAEGGLTNGDREYGNIELITNLDKTNINNSGHIYKEEEKNRVYKITVELSRNGKVYSTLTSTVSANDPTPTPTPP